MPLDRPGAFDFSNRQPLVQDRPCTPTNPASRTATQDGPKKESPSIHLAGLSGFPTGGSLRFGWPMVGRFQVVVGFECEK